MSSCRVKSVATDGCRWLSVADVESRIGIFLKHTMKSLARIETGRFLLVAILMLPAAWGCAIVDKLTWQHARAVSHVFDLAAFVLFWASYNLLWVLLVVGPFRPRAEFSLRGACCDRAANFFIALGALVLIHLWVVLALCHVLRNP